MLLAKIDMSAYPVVRIESLNPLKIPSRARTPLEFYPKGPKDPFLTYFREDEKENEKFYNSNFWCRDSSLY